MIDKAELNDLKEILDLQYLAYQSEAKLFNNYKIQPLTETLDELIGEYKKGVILKLVIDFKIIGSIRAYVKDDTVFIGKLMVHPDYQHKGYGTMLLSEMENRFPDKRYELFTSTRSVDNIRLYQKLGYTTFAQKAVNDELEFVYMEKK